MLRLVRLLWTGSWHEHAWEIYRQGRIATVAANITRGNWYDLRCKHCGAMKRRQFEV